MKRILVASALLAMTGIANAGLSFSTSSVGVRTEAFNVANLPTFATGTQLNLGSLVTNETGVITFTYLGQESGYVNALHLGINNQNLYESNAVGTSISALVNNLGAIDFRFFENTSPANYAVNGGYWAPNTSIGLVGQNLTFANNSYAFVLGYNDSAGVARLGDWDDLVVGVNFVPTTPVPEPDTYAMLMAGLGILGWTARRKRKSAAVE
jgi:hypothetical protein